jgi:hypothetical protein
MKKMIFVLTALLLAAPAMAGVTFSCAQDGTNPNVVISFIATEDANLPRGMGLVVTCSDDTAISTGTPVATDPCYWVYPGTIDINSAGVVEDYGNPVVATADANTVIIEMGSLHSPTGAGDAGAPSLATSLITLQLTQGSNASTTVTLSADAERGNVVNYAAAEADYSFGAPCTISFGCWTGDAASTTEWESVGSPDCWCASNQPRQCHGDADGLPYGKGNYWVSSQDLNVFLTALNKNYATIEGQVYDHGSYTTPLICADYDHLPYGKGAYRVSSQDLNIFLKWLNKSNLPDPNCQDVTGSQE